MKKNLGCFHEMTACFSHLVCTQNMVFFYLNVKTPMRTQEEQECIRVGCVPLIDRIPWLSVFLGRGDFLGGGDFLEGVTFWGWVVTFLGVGDFLGGVTILVGWVIFLGVGVFFGGHFLRDLTSPLGLDYLSSMTMWPISWCIWCHLPPNVTEWQTPAKTTFARFATRAVKRTDWRRLTNDNLSWWNLKRETDATHENT